MRCTGWLLAAMVTVAPAFARANAKLDKPHAELDRGVSLVVAGKFAEAEKPLRESLRLDPTLCEAHYNLAIALRHEGRLDDAIDEYQRAADGFASEPNRAKALYGMSLAREARGDKDAWDAYLAFARPLRNEQATVRIAQDHRDVINGVKVPGSYQKASR